MVLATREMSLTIVGNAKSNNLQSHDLQLAWKKLEKDGIINQEKIKLMY